MATVEQDEQREAGLFGFSRSWLSRCFHAMLCCRTHPQLCMLRCCAREIQTSTEMTVKVSKITFNANTACTSSYRPSLAISDRRQASYTTNVTAELGPLLIRL